MQVEIRTEPPAKWSDRMASDRLDPDRPGSRPRLVGPPLAQPAKPLDDHLAVAPLPSSPAATGLSVTKDDPRIERVANSRISVLIVGETGAGKEVLAQRLHSRSGRANKPLVSVNCAAFCGSLIDSALFGHQRGAFTGAEQAKVGLIEAADGGTLFLDEVGELSASAQTKLLRVLETREVLRVGAIAARPVDVRFIAATNLDLDAAVAEGRFREDLLFRLDAIRLHVPPLRERADEIVPAAREFLQACAQREGRPAPELTPAAEEALRRHAWKGNFRELRNVVERAALICADDRILAGDLLLPEERATTTPRDPGPPAPSAVTAAAPSTVVARTSLTPPAMSTAWSPPPVASPVPMIFPPTFVTAAPPRNSSTLERDQIVAALKECAGNQTRAARLLGISRRTLITRLEAFGVARPRVRPLRVVAAPLPAAE